MADSRPFQVRDAAGALVTGAGGSFSVVAFDTRGNARTPPAVVEPFPGSYRVRASDSDESERTVVLVDCGAGRYPRRYCFAVSRPDGANQFWAFVVEQADLTLWANASDPPTILAGSFVDADGLARPVVPELRAVAGAYLWACVPSPADIEADSQLIFVGPTGSAQPSWQGSTERRGVTPSPFHVPNTGALLRTGNAIAKLR